MGGKLTTILQPGLLGLLAGTLALLVGISPLNPQGRYTMDKGETSLVHAPPNSIPPSPAPSPYEFPKLFRFPKMPVSPQNPVTREGVELGRYLFYDPLLSRDSTLSCGSCHKQEYAFSDGPQTFSTGIGGKQLDRNTPPLFNLAWYPALFWDGRASTLEEQVFHPVRAHEEMDLDWPTAVHRIQNSSLYPAQFEAAFGTPMIDSTRIAYAIAQFERTLLSDNSRYDQALRREVVLSEEEYAGFVLMNDQTKGDCLHCHTSDSDPLGTILRFSNNGLDPASSPEDYPDPGLGGITGNPEETGQFKIPSLRNIALTAPYMHDGRFATLEAVLEFYSEGVHPGVNTDPKMGFAHQGGAHLTQEEQEQIIAFLHTFTDSSFITDPRFSNPFETLQPKEDP